MSHPISPPLIQGATAQMPVLALIVNAVDLHSALAMFVIEAGELEA